MNHHRRNKFDFGDFEITKREILASISIIIVMLFIGVLISSKISERQMDKNEIYNKAVKIESKDLFQHGMNTNVGNAFVYGDLKVVDTVTFDEIGGQYMYVEKVKERYTMHTRIVTKTRIVNGKSKSYTTTETYWTWDRVGSEEIKCKEIKFCDIILPSSKIKFPSSNYISTINGEYHIRYKYYGVPIEHKGTIFTNLKDKTISDNSPFYNNMSIEETVEHLESNSGIVIFWVVWIILICGCVYGFYYIDNEWLE